jgi:hypothetical protein
MKFFNKNSSKFLLAFCDTEGVSSKNGLWSITILIKAIVSSKETFLTKNSNIEYEKGVFNLITFDSSNSSSTTKKAIQSHKNALVYLNRFYKTNGVIMCFWHGSHDVKQLNFYNFFENMNLKIYFSDLIKLAKSLSTFPSYKLSKIKQIYYKKPTSHTSLQDTLDMLDLMFLICIDYNYQKQIESSATVDEIKKISEQLSEDKKFKLLLKNNFFIGLFENVVEDIGVERRSSFDLNHDENDPKYEYFNIDDVEFKIKKGFEKSESISFSGFGLYEKIDGKYKRILKKIDKMNVLDAYLEKKRSLKKSVL